MVRVNIKSILLVILPALSTLACPLDLAPVLPGGVSRAEAAEVLQIVTREGEGESPVEEEDLGTARSQALESALQDAFEQALREVLPADLSLESQDRLTRQLSPEKKSFLLRYRILSEMPTQSLFFLTVEASFSSALMKRALVKTGVLGGPGDAAKVIQVRLRVEGLASFQGYADLLNFLRTGISGVRAVKLVEVYGTTSIFMLACSGGPAGVAEQLPNFGPGGDDAVRVNVSEQEVTLFLAPFEVQEQSAPVPSSVPALP